ncbi:MAG: NERD domain-containing protein [Anaerolineae bacterium]|nr:NERD domain-containing protein [Anaerolineae bacterium]MDW8172215.1 nuclease-related domain-containing protein [Anaerolineae bacterium]
MQIVVPEATLSRRARSLLLAALLLGALSLLVGAIAAALFVVPLVVPSNPSFPTYDAARQIGLIVAGVGLALALLLALRALTLRRDNATAERVGQALAAFVPAGYLYIRNVSKPRLGYIDAVLIGTAGVLVLRTVERTGVFYAEAQRWMIQRDRDQWRTLRWSPTREALHDMKQLERFLAKQGLSAVPIEGLIVFIAPPPTTTIHAPAALVPIAQLHTLEDVIQRHFLVHKGRLSVLDAERAAKLIYR